MSGRVFAVVGPSGAGKDTVMAAAGARCSKIHLVRRVITRPSDAGGEDFDGVSAPEFDRLCAAGAFALHWQAHGLRYGIPISVEDRLAEGRVVLFNGSRAMLGAAQSRFPGLGVLHVTAPVAVLAARLAARGRESAPEIAARLARADYALPAAPPVVTIRNDGPLEDAVQAMLSAVAPERV